MNGVHSYATCYLAASVANITLVQSPAWASLRINSYLFYALHNSLIPT